MGERYTSHYSDHCQQVSRLQLKMSNSWLHKRGLDFPKVTRKMDSCHLFPRWYRQDVGKTKFKRFYAMIVWGIQFIIFNLRNHQNRWKYSRYRFFDYDVLNFGEKIYILYDLNFSLIHDCPYSIKQQKKNDIHIILYDH